MSSSIIVFILVLGLLIAFHEFGHFLAAKACNIYVDRFSIGMPPRLFGVKWGETDYCIGALPIGGFVKMAGQEDAPMDDEQREQEYGHVPEDRWFNKKPVWQRYIVIIAGPFMNLVLAVLLYGILAAYGDLVPSSALTTQIGQVEEGSPAASAPLYMFEDGEQPDTGGEPDATGWRTMDKVVSLDGRPIDKFEDLIFDTILSSKEGPHEVVIERPHPDGTSTRYLSLITPEFIGEERDRPRFGVGPYQFPLVDNIQEDMPAADSGLKEGDIVKWANGKPVDISGFIEMTEKVTPGETMALKVERDGELKEVQVAPITLGRIPDLATSPPYIPESGENAEAVPTVSFIGEKLSEQTKLQAKDRIVEINGEPATAKLLYEMQKNNLGETLTFKVERPSILLGFVQEADTLTVQVPIESVRAIGVRFGQKMEYYRVPPSQIVPEAFKKSYKAVERTVLTLKGLITGGISVSNLGGPVMIFQVTTRAAELGFYWLLEITAFISINLAILNLLPIPVLDGGLLVIHGIEGIRRKPLSAKFQERFAIIGLVCIISLMLFVTYNDIARWIESLRP